MSKQVLQRIANKDMKECAKLESSNIYVNFDEEDITKASAMIVGPKDTPYFGGLFFFRIKFPVNYPFSPPLVSYWSTSNIRIHPNLYRGIPSKNFEGKVCLSVLNTWSGPKWTTIMDLSSILLIIQSIMDDKPLFHEPGFEKSPQSTIDLYNNMIEGDVLKQICNHYNSFPGDFSCFKEVGIKHIIENKSKHLDILNKKDTKFKQMSFKIYNLISTVNYEELSRLMNKFE